ncbi:MAG: hypothetical protein P8174_03125 [Gemmatimonadota bacterium]
MTGIASIARILVPSRPRVPALPLVCLALLLPACAHAPVAGALDVSGQWAGDCDWKTSSSVSPGQVLYQTTRIRFALRLEDSNGRITGTGMMAYARFPERRPFPVNVSGSVQGKRVRLRMEFPEGGLRRIDFSGLASGADSMKGAVFYPGMERKDFVPVRNSIALTRVGLRIDDSASRR